MLSLVTIKNLALVDDLTWEVGTGLVCVTGETGAGKSVIVGALKLVLGDRADRSLIRTGEEQCSVEAVFHLRDPANVNARLEDFGLDPCEEDSLVVRRVISASGSNKQFVNCSPVPLSVLKGLSEFLVDLHGPHDHHSLLSPDRQLYMLDAAALAPTTLETYRDAHRSWRSALSEFEEASTSRSASSQELELLRYQVDEIAAAQLGGGDGSADEDLETRYQRASQGQRLLGLSDEALNRFSGVGTSVVAGMEDISRLLNDLERLDPTAAELTENFRSCQMDLLESEAALRDYAGGLSFDPAELGSLEERVNTLETLKRKYGNTVEEILAFHEDAARRLAMAEDRGELLAELQAAVDAARVSVDKFAATLSKKRKAQAPKLAKAVAAHLKDLGFKQSKFEVEIVPLDAPGPHGAETVEFMFSPNPGEPLKPLRQIASSGEMARVMLAVKSALTGDEDIPLLVFDEIDSNVGGEIATAVGAKMASLGEHHQVISITHLPQVAALACSHYFVQKEVSKGRTRSLLNEVRGEDRANELARMLGGATASALAHAESLLAA